MQELEACDIDLRIQQLKNEVDRVLHKEVA